MAQTVKEWFDENREALHGDYAGKWIAVKKVAPFGVIAEAESAVKAATAAAAAGYAGPAIFKLAQ